MRRRFRRIFRGLSRRHWKGGFRLDLLARSVEDSGIGEVVFTHGFLSGWYFLLSVRYAFLISFSEADLASPRTL